MPSFTQQLQDQDLYLVEELSPLTRRVPFSFKEGYSLETLKEQAENLDVTFYLEDEDFLGDEAISHYLLYSGSELRVIYRTNNLSDLLNYLIQEGYIHETL